jgi:hypothetical protein
MDGGQRGTPDYDRWVLQGFRPKLTKVTLSRSENILRDATLFYKNNSQTCPFVSIFAIITELAFLYGSDAQEIR